MVGVPFPHGFVSVDDYLSSNKEFHCFVSIFSGIVLCRIVYKLTGLISSCCFERYGKLSKAEKVEWNNRGFSTFHAIFVAFASAYLLLSDLFKEDSHDELIIDRKSTLSDTVLGISIGYFLSDLAMIFWNFPALGGLEYVLHHALSMFSIILSLGSGKAQFYILMVLFTESTTPFVNLRWYLDIAGQKGSTLYICNGIALFVGWLVARVLLFIFLFVHMLVHFDQSRVWWTWGSDSETIADLAIASGKFSLVSLCKSDEDITISYLCGSITETKRENLLTGFAVSKDTISFRLLQCAGGATCVRSHEPVLVLEDCKRFDQNPYQGKTRPVMRMKSDATKCRKRLGPLRPLPWPQAIKKRRPIKFYS
ncbi:hypothetical protein FNV43_RR05214 [Rhamnella rubrinervis]|uniref:TLC domain-containing protein n=1 Tax=Rhamnella rubrinervis TaxID=2594499 RepID=A0A8K0HLP2_9ROSA|nr:hypothetical protein FNV43_RR05214 [Rhamnella rubrinervis]